MNHKLIIQALGLKLEELSRCGLDSYFYAARAELQFEQNAYLIRCIEPDAGASSITIQTPNNFYRPLSRHKVTAEQLEVLSQLGRMSKSFANIEGSWMWQSCDRILYPAGKIEMQRLCDSLTKMQEYCSINALEAKFLNVPKAELDSTGFESSPVSS